jgi:hypothetical protein
MPQHLALINQPCLYCGLLTPCNGISLALKVTKGEKRLKRTGTLCKRCNERDAPPHSDWLRLLLCPRLAPHSNGLQLLLCRLAEDKIIAGTIARYLDAKFEFFWEASLEHTV